METPNANPTPDRSAPAEGAPESLGAALRASRKARRLTMAALAERVGCARTYLCDVERGRKKPSLELLSAIERALLVPAGRLVEASRWQDAPASMKAEVARARAAERAGRELAGALREARGARALDALHRSGRLRRIIDRLDPAGRTESVGARGGGGDVAPIALAVEVPLINSVAAGYPTEFTDLGYSARVADEYVRSPDIRDADAFAARVVGDSMEPRYSEGDIVIFSPAKAVKSGMDCFVRLEGDGGTTFKRVFFPESGRVAEWQSGKVEEGGKARRQTSDVNEDRETAVEVEAGMIVLQPLNGKYPVRKVPREMVAGLYAAVSVMRSV